MPGQSVTLPEALPRSHYFVTVSRGAGMRTWAIRTAVAHLALALLPLAALAGIGGGVYVVFHDDVLASVMSRQSAMQYAYEDRIDGLRQDLERQAARGRADQAAVESRLRDLLAREARLESRAAVVADLSGTPGGGALRAPPALPPQITGRAAPPAGALGYAAPEKPRPLVEPAPPGAAATPEDHAALGAGLPVGEGMVAADLALDRVERGQVATVSRLGAAARERATRLRALIEEAGLSPERYLAKPGPGVGGPFVPLPQDRDGTFGRAVAELRAAVAVATQLGEAVTRLPLSAPLAGRAEVTSPFGARLDPFLGRAALHTGVDLREGYGSDIRSTAAGRVTFAGVMGGYGDMVEVDHGNGVATRYAHMGAVAVAEGQTVSRGTVLGHVGSTGRATGPHLHYEVRIDGEPVDPMRFLQIADRADPAMPAPGR